MPCRAKRQASAQGGVHGAIEPSAMGWAPFQLGLRLHQATKQEGTNLCAHGEIMRNWNERLEKTVILDSIICNQDILFSF